MASVSLLYIHALSSLHPGTGQGVGAIDLPIARERATNLPFAPGSSLKGCLRQGKKDDVAKQRFGDEDRQGDLAFSDARLLLLPLRSVSSTFVWATCPYLLRRYRRDCRMLPAQLTAGLPAATPTVDAETAAGSKTVEGLTLNQKPKLVLEDLDFDLKAGPAEDWAAWFANALFASDSEWIAEFKKRFVILPDSAFDFLCEYATEVNAHIRIGEDGIVEEGALWYEESLPAETVLVSIVENRGANDLTWMPEFLRLGGNESTGQGLTRLVRHGG